jgi:hypothetical protein
VDVRGDGLADGTNVIFITILAQNVRGAVYLHLIIGNKNGYQLRAWSFVIHYSFTGEF